MTPTRRAFRAGALIATAALALAACSSEGGAQSEEQAAGGSGDAPAVEDTGLTIAMVTHEAPGDTFWDKIRAGAEAAAERHGLTLRYSNDNEAAGQATLIQNAVDSGVDGLAVTLSFQEAVRPAIQAALDAGIPAVAFNQGIDDWEEYGLAMYFGSDETLAGNTVGERLTEEGAGKALCVIQEQGSAALEARCGGVAETFADTENINVDGTDLPGTQAALTAKLQQDTAITHVVTLGAPIALAALDSIDSAGSEATVVTFDLNVDAAQAIQDGRILFSVDQQPYVQGYLAVSSLWLNLTNGNDIGGGQAVLTGPSIVDESNIEQILPYTQNNTR
ncbi:MAG TPA: substrate-binding domain-containing protein [Jiangellales bacterium]|nr:substrate-binding domain-containing protein [Jiangellales bacterium]